MNENSSLLRSEGEEPVPVAGKRDMWRGWLLRPMMPMQAMEGERVSILLGYVGSNLLGSRCLKEVIHHSIVASS